MNDDEAFTFALFFFLKKSMKVKVFCLKGKVVSFMKTANYLKGYFPWQSEFDHHYACWASNHRGWAKMKKSNKRLAKKRENRNWRRQISYGERQT